VRSYGRIAYPPHRIMQTIIKYFWKLLWFAKNRIYQKILWLFYKASQGGFFKKVGAGVIFFGNPTFGSVEGNISVGDKSLIGRKIFLSCSKDGEITIGDHCSINTGCHLVAIKGIRIDRGTLIGEYVSIRDQNHGFEDPNMLVLEQGFSANPIVIEEDCWIGRSVFIRAGVTLGKGCVVGANSVVTKSFEPYSVIAGIPAHLIRHRGDKLEH
jgi:acetyltransferase-like isoleucine patch superfamily enzyme